jgi:RNA polymerase sigma factor (TIGR02999 family)
MFGGAGGNKRGLAGYFQVVSMSDPRRNQITAVLRSYVEAGEPAIGDELMELVYDDLRLLAARLLRGERRGHTLSATDLVHEAYTRLVDQTRVDWRGRTHFFAIAAQAMRRILIDHARKHGRARRGGDWQRVTLDVDVVGQADAGLGPEELIALDAALTKLASLDAREAQVVELRFFVGLSNEEIAEFLGVSTRSVTRDWLHARSWLRRELATGEAASLAIGPQEAN